MKVLKFIREYLKNETRCQSGFKSWSDDRIEPAALRPDEARLPGCATSRRWTGSKNSTLGEFGKIENQGRQCARTGSFSDGQKKPRQVVVRIGGQHALLR